MYGEIVTRLRYKPTEIHNTFLTINGTEASLSINPPEIPFPVLSEYEYCTIFLESFENNKDTLYEVKYEIHYKWNELLYKIGEVTSVDGKAEFPRLIKGMSYYVTAIPLDGKYQSKQVRITLDEYDIRQEPVAITTYENPDYKNYEHYLILKNIFGDATVYLEGNPDYISLDRNDKNLRVYLNKDATERASEFDLFIEDYRIEDIIIARKKILVNDGFSTPYDISIEFTDSNAAIFKWSTDGIYEINRFYISDNTINKGNPIDVIGTSTYIITNYDTSKTQYIWISSLRDGKEKISDPITINAVDPHLDKVEALFNFKYGEVITDKSLYKKTVTMQGNPTLQSDNSLYFDGTDDRISVPINPLLTDDFTYEIYYKPTNDTSRINQRLIQVGKNQASIGTFCLCKDEYSQRLALWIVESNNNWVKLGTSTFEMTPFTLYHICLQRKNGIFYVYVDGSNVLVIDSKPTFSITDNILYIGLTDSNGINDALIGYVHSVRLTKGLRYNDNFNIPEYKFPINHKITKPDNISYFIKDNNDLQIDIIHESNNVDNYSVYLEENEITSIDGLTPIATSASKNIVIPNFDVYNNYDRTLKLVATTNKYNHSYLSENKDLYVAYDWTPAKMSVPLSIFLDSNNLVFSENKIINWNDSSGNNNHFSTVVASQPTLSNLNGVNIAVFDGNVQYLTNSTSKSLYRNANSGWIFIVAKRISGANILSHESGISNNLRLGTGSTLGSARLDSDNIVNPIGSGAIDNKWSMKYGLVDWQSGKMHLYLDGNSDPISNTFTPGKTSDTDSISGTTIGIFKPDTSTSNKANCEVACVIMGTNNIPSINDINNLFGWAAHKYGLTDNLPVDHPYKTKRPIIDHTPSFTYTILED